MEACGETSARSVAIQAFTPHRPEQKAEHAVTQLDTPALPDAGKGNIVTEHVADQSLTEIIRPISATAGHLDIEPHPIRHGFEHQVSTPHRASPHPSSQAISKTGASSSAVRVTKDATRMSARSFGVDTQQRHAGVQVGTSPQHCSDELPKVSQLCQTQKRPSSVSRFKLTHKELRLEPLLQNVQRVVSGTGNVFSGTLPVSQHQYMVFDSTCTDATVSDAVAEGGTIVCCGSGCNVTFSNVSFKHCSLVVLGGGHVTITGCSFDGVMNDGHSVYHICQPLAGGAVFQVTAAIYACDSKSVVRMEKCHITSCQIGVAALSGARVTGVDVHFKNSTETGALVVGAGSQLILNNCSVQCTRTQRTPGVCAQHAGHVELNHVTFTLCSMAVKLSQNSVALLQQCSVSQSLMGVYADHSSGTLRKCIFLGMRSGKVSDEVHASESKGHAMVEAHTGSHLVLEECRLLRNNTHGACALNASTLVCTACRTECSRNSGFGAQDGAMLKLTDCISEGDAFGVYINNAGCELDRVAVKACKRGGFFINNPRSKAVLTTCSAVAQLCGTQLLCATGSGCQVAVSECKFDECPDAGSKVKGPPKDCTIAVFATDGANMKLRACSMCSTPRSVHSEGLSVEGEATAVTAEACTLTGKSGVSVSDQATVTMHDCKTKLCRMGYRVQSGGQLHLSDCSSTADDVGLLCRAGFGLLAAKACQVSDSKVPAFLEGPGQVTLTDTRIDRSQSTVTGTDACSKKEQMRGEGVMCTGVRATGKGLKLEMVRCVVTKTGGSGLLLQNSASASLRGCTFSDAQHSGVAVEARGTELRMEHCVMEGNTEMGVSCKSGALVHAQHCHTTKNSAGYSCTGGQMKLTMCSSLRDEFGVIVRDFGGGAAISLEQVLVRQSTSCGFFLCGCIESLTGGLIMKNCAAVKCGRSGIHLESAKSIQAGKCDRATSKCGDIVDCAFHANTSYAISASRGCQMKLKNVVCNRHQRCVLGQGRGVVLEGCECGGCADERCPLRC